MVSADNLDYDVLSIVFSYLANPNDYASIALVSKSFQVAVIPKLYKTLSFRLHHAKRYPSVCMQDIFEVQFHGAYSCLHRS